MAGINYVLKVVDKASKAIKAPGDEAEKASLKIKEYERQLKILNDIEMKNEATYFNYDKDIKYNKSKINSGTLTKEEELSARSEIRDLELKKEESAIKGERISKMISSTEGKLQEQKLIKELKENSESENGNTKVLGDMVKSIGSSISMMAIANSMMKTLTNAMKNGFEQSKADIRINTLAGDPGAANNAKAFANLYGIGIEDSVKAYGSYMMLFKQDQEMAMKYMKFTDFITKGSGANFGDVANLISGAIQGGNGESLASVLGTDWQGKRGLAFTNDIKGRSYDDLINRFIEYSNENNWTEDKYKEVINSNEFKFEKKLKQLENHMSGRSDQTSQIIKNLEDSKKFNEIMGNDTSEIQAMIDKWKQKVVNLDLLKGNDIFNLPDAPNSLHNNISMLNNEEVELLSGVGSRAAVGKQTKNNVTIYITNNESETPPERIGEIVKEKIDEYTNEGIEGGTNEYY